MQSARSSKATCTATYFHLRLVFLRHTRRRNPEGSRAERLVLIRVIQLGMGGQGVGSDECARLTVVPQGSPPAN